MKIHDWKILALITVVPVPLIPAHAATHFTSPGGLLSVAGNWDNGLPTGGNPGTIGISATANTTILDGYDITQTDGTLTPSGATVLNIGTGSYKVDGAGGGSPQVSG